MKTITTIIIALFLSVGLNAQEIVGSWMGILDVQGNKMRIGFNFNKTGESINTTMDSPDQKAFGIPAKTISLLADDIHISIENMKVEYKGKLSSNGEIIGTFIQGGYSFPLNISKTKKTETKQLRPQNPTKPFPYHSEDINFKNKKANISLAGTFTKPNSGSNFTTVILITGSGAQNRDEEIAGHKPFLVLSDYITKQGYGVLRYDDRGTFKSEGDFGNSTSKDFASDVESAIEYLKSRTDVNPNKIGLIGHSEGGLIAPMVGQDNSDVAFIILLAGTGVTGKEIILDQQDEMNRLSGLSETENRKAVAFSESIFNYIVENNRNSNKEELSSFISGILEKKDGYQLPKGQSKKGFIKTQVKQLSSPWFKYFLMYNPQPALEKLKCPVLAINGSKDIQVKSSLNLPVIEKALSKNKHALTEVKELAQMNHLFQVCETGAVSEYETIEETFSPKALKIISDWMSKL